MSMPKAWLPKQLQTRLSSTCPNICPCIRLDTQVHPMISCWQPQMVRLLIVAVTVAARIYLYTIYMYTCGHVNRDKEDGVQRKVKLTRNWNFKENHKSNEKETDISRKIENPPKRNWKFNETWFWAPPFSAPDPQDPEMKRYTAYIFENNDSHQRNPTIVYWQFPKNTMGWTPMYWEQQSMANRSQSSSSA